MKCKVSIGAEHVQVGQTPWWTTWTGTGQGGTIRQLQKAGDTVIQTKQKQPQHVITPDKPVNKMVPVPSRKCTKTKGVPKKHQSGTTVSLNPMSPHYNSWFTKLLQSPVIAQPVFYANQGSSCFGFKSTQAHQVSDQPQSSPLIE